MDSHLRAEKDPRMVSGRGVRSSVGELERLKAVSGTKSVIQSHHLCLVSSIPVLALAPSR